MIKRVPCLVALTLTWWLTAVNSGRGQEPSQAAPPSDSEPIRELFVPFEDLRVLLGDETQRVFMTREEFEQLKQRAKQTPTQELPLNVALLAADYQAVIQHGRATMRGNLIVEVLQEGLHALSLPFAHVGLRSASLDGAPASLASASGGPVTLFVEGIGKHRLVVDLVMPVATEAAQQTLRFQVPTAPASRLSLAVPGNVEVKSGAAVLDRTIDAEKNETQFDLLLTTEPMAIVMSLNNRKLREQSTVMARGVLVAEVTEAYERLHATMSMNVLNGAVDEFRFAVADDLDVNAVSCDLLSRWAIESANGKKELVVSLRTPATTRVVVNVRLDRIAPQLAQWRLATFRPVNVAGDSTVVGLLIEDRLRAANIAPQSLIAIDSQVLTSALPQSLLDAEPGAPRVHAIAAFYAPTAQFSLMADLSVPKGRLVVSSNSLLTVAERGMEVTGGLSLIPENEKLFFVDFLVPAGWNVNWVKTSEDKDLNFERYVTDEKTRIRVLLPGGVAPGVQQSVLFHAEHTPADWLGDWDSQSIDFPAFPVADAQAQTGAVAVQVEDDLVVMPETTQGLLVLNENEKVKFQLGGIPTALAFRYDTNLWRASLNVTRTAPRVIGRALSFFQIQPQAVQVHCELVFLVEQARVRQVAFSLPESTPTEISIRGLAGLTVKETTSSVAAGRRVWEANLSEPRMGAVRLAVDFTQRLDEEEPQGLQLPVVRTENVAYQSAAVSIEGHPELEITLTDVPRPVDIGELVDADYQIGKRLLGAFGYVGNDDDVVLDVTRRPVHGLPTTIVERAELVTLVSSSGVSQTAARFRLRTKAIYLETRLPEEASLWSVILNGKPALPQREQDRVIIALPANSSTTTQDLQIVYETPSDSILFRGNVDVIAPELAEREDRNGGGQPIPIADLQWRLVLPEGYRLASSGGNVTPSRDTSRAFAVRGLLERLGQLGGGLRANIGLRAGTSVTGQTSDSSVATANQSVPLDGLDLRDEASLEEAPGELRASLDAPATVQSETAEMNATQAEQPPAEAPNVSFADGDTAQASAETDQERKPTQDKGDARQRRKSRLWALEGVRSLAINLSQQQTGETIDLASLGTEPRAEIVIVHARRLTYLATACGILVFVLGLACVARCRRARVRYIFIVALLAVLLPQIVGRMVELESIQQAILESLMLLGIYFLLESICRMLASRWGKGALKAAPSPAGKVAVLWLAGMTLPMQSSLAQAPTTPIPPIQTVSGADQLAHLLQALGDETTVSIPEDAVVIPYSSEDPAGVASAEKLLVPYATYAELWKLANPDQQLETPKPPAPYAWSAASYSVVLDGSDDSPRVVGRLGIDQFVDGEIAIPLQLSGFVLESATLDGKTARLQLIQAAVPTDQQQVQQMQQPAGDSSKTMLMLYLSGKGRKQLDISLRRQLEKRGGWRVLDGIVPSAPAGELLMTAARPRTEIRLTGGIDRAVVETTTPNERIETALPHHGRLSVQWREKVTQAAVDQGLTVRSRAVFDVREDALRLAWNGTLEFRRGLRESLAFRLPRDYLIEKVIGDNVRGWTSKQVDGAQQLDVELLKAATDRESLSIFVSRPTSLGQEGNLDLAVPRITVPDAMLHQGQFTVRRSALLDLRTSTAEGLRRIDAPDESQWLGDHQDAGPLPSRVYQAFQFSQPSYALQLSASVIAYKMDVEAHTLVKISQRETTFETRLLVTSGGRPIHHVRVALPYDLQLETPGAPGDFQWSVSKAEQNQILELYLASGQLGTFPIILRGKLTGSDAEAFVGPPAPPTPDDASTTAAATRSPLMELPKLQVLDARRQTGAIVVQADPAYGIRAEDLLGCEVALLNSVHSWLSASQRRLARVVVRYSSTDFSGTLRIAPRTPVVSSYSVTNVKVTDRSIEETIYIESTVRSAGIREYVFLLPAELAAARIQAPLLRQKTVTPINAQPNAPVRVRLELQDAIMGQLRIIVEHNRLLTTGEQTAPLPIIETGSTTRRLITLENASRDELIPTQRRSVERLQREQLLQRFQADLLGGKASEAYLVREGDASPLLTFETKDRETVETAGARIGLAQTLLVVDDSGAYRAAQEYRVENRTEPFLEIEMPADARLWTVLVADEPVKPARASSATPNHIRVPLIKTAEGDLDYAVVLKYGGKLKRPGLFRQYHFPLIRTVNINVELSQVRLRLPETHRWFNFSGTMGRVQTEGELQAGWFEFRTRQLGELSQLFSSSGKMYSKARASNNLKQLESAIQQTNKYYQEQTTVSDELRRQMDANAEALQQAQRQAAQLDLSSSGEPTPGNRSVLNDLYNSQLNTRSFNIVEEAGANFTGGALLAGDSAQPSGNTAATLSPQFDNGWLFRNSLGEVQTKKDRGLERLEKSSQNEQRLFGGRYAAPQAPVLNGGKALSGDGRPATDDTTQRLLGDHRRQVERYNKRLQQKSPRGGEQSNRAASNRAMRVGPINQPSSSTSSPAAGPTIVAGVMQEPQAFEGGYGGAAFGDVGGGGGLAQGSPTLDFAPSALPNDQPASGLADGGLRGAYMASLDVELPQRGREVLFMTPRGQISISAQSVSAEVYQRVVSILWILALAVAVWVGYRLYCLAARSRTGRVWLAAFLAIAGAASLLLGILPIYGLLAVFAAIGLFLYSSDTIAAVPEAA